MIEKLKKFFDKIGNPILYILKTPRAGEIVDNGMGVEMPLYEFAVIHEGTLYEDDKTKKVYDFQNKENIEFIRFSVENCDPSVEDFLQELKDMDGYEVIWKKK